MADKNMEAQISVEFEEATSRQSLNSGETINTLWSKVKRWLSDLKTVCFSGSYNDLSDTPTTATTESDGLMSAEDKTKLDSADDTYALKSKYGDTTIDVGRKAGTDVGEYSTAEGDNTTASARGSHAEGGMTYAKGIESHAEGSNTYAIANCSHAEGYSTRAEYSHAHAEGGLTIARGYDTHAEGAHTTAHGEGSHAEGISSYNIYESIPKFSNSTSINDIITSWMAKPFTLSKGKGSHAEGNNTLALGDYSHTEGHSTRATKTAEHASGQFNKSNSDTLFSVGDGTADDARHNAFEITTTGGKLHDEEIMTQNNISNPNLLINPDFGINQYGFSSKTISTSQTYFIDHWYGSRCTVAKNSNGGIDLSWNGIDGSDGWIQQKIENTKYLFGKDVIISADVDGIRKSAHIVVPTTTNASAYYAFTDKIKVAISNYAGNYISVVIYNNSAVPSNINNIKLEVGASATPFIPYNPAAELIKCQRYYQIRSTNNIAAADLRPNMREGITPTIMALSGGNYSYSAEL